MSDISSLFCIIEEKTMKIRIISLVTTLLVLITPAVHAADITISGYASFAGTNTNAKDTTDNYATYSNGLANKDAQFDTTDSHLGLQISAAVSDKVDMTAELYTEGGSANYNLEAQFAYATYHFTDQSSVRMGKYKGAFYMVSDYKDVGYAYPWVRPPLEVYSTNPIKALSGIDFVYQSQLAGMYWLTELYVGSGTHSAKVLPSTVDGTPYPNPKGSTLSFETPSAKGINISATGDIGTFRLGYFEALVNQADFMITEKKGTFLGIGFNIDWNDIVVYSELIQRDTDPALAGAFPDQNAAYLTLGYRMGNFLPYVTYAELAKGKDASPFAQLQSSVALGLRTEVSDAAALKFEIMKVTPEKNPLASGFNTTNAGYGLFDNPVKDGTVATVTFDVIF